MAIPITEIKGIGPKTAELLAEHGYRTAEELAAAQPNDLAVISGFGFVRANLVIEEARTLTSEPRESPASEQIVQPAAVTSVETEPQEQEPAQLKKKSTKKKGKGKKKKEEKSKNKKQDRDKKKKQKKKKEKK